MSASPSLSSSSSSTSTSTSPTLVATPKVMIKQGPSIPGGSLPALRDFILTLPTEPASQLSLISQVLSNASPAVKDPVVDLVRRLVGELSLLCPEEEFFELARGQGYECAVPFRLSEEREVRVWEVYREMMSFGPARYSDFFDLELQTIAFRLGCGKRTADGFQCPDATIQCLNDLIRHVLLPIQNIYVSQKACTYMFGAVLYRMGMRLVGSSPNFSLRPIRPVDVEMRDQQAYIALRYTDKELLAAGVAREMVRQWRRQSCYVFEDQWRDILARMELHKSRYLAAMKGCAREGGNVRLRDVGLLDRFVLEQKMERAQQEACEWVGKREVLVRARMSFNPVHSLVKPQVIAAFWRLVHTFLPLAQALREAIPFWLVRNLGTAVFQAEQVDLCIRNLTLLKEQDLSRNGIRQLTGTPLYILSFEALLEVIKSTHALHRVMSRDLFLRAPMRLGDVGAWPTGEWLVGNGFSAELGRVELGGI